MLSKSQIQFITSLAVNKYRRLNRMFIAEGPKLAQELLASHFAIEAIYAVKKWIQENRKIIHSGIKIIEINENELEKISNLKTPNQILAVVKFPESLDNDPPIPKDNIMLFLDGISDPGNMGTIIRTADWFGVRDIVCSEDCVDIYNPKVVQATMGSVFRVSINYVSPEKYFQNLPKNIQVYGTLLDGENLYQADLGKSGIVIIGNESHGISRGLLPFITNKIKIPDYSADSSFSAESLNASVATAIVISEFARRRLMPK